MKTLFLSCIVIMLTFSCLPGKVNGQTTPSAPKNLKEVQITGNRPVIKQEADRIIYDMQADPDSRSNNVLDMMRKVPFLSLDANNNILLKGNNNYRIFINGKPSGMLTNNPVEVLRSMPASSIKRIEVITIPPSKYDAEGLAGIINIILLNNVNNGMNGSLNANGKFPQGGPGIGSAIAIKQGKLGISGFGGGSINNTPAIDITNSRNTFITHPAQLLQTGTNKSNIHTGYIGVEISYEVDSLHLLYTSFNTYLNNSTGDNKRTSILTSEDLLVEGYQFNSNFRNKGDGLDAGINYQLGFKADKNRLLTFSYNYRNNQTDFNNEVLFSNRINYTLPAFQQYNNGQATEQTGQIDYVHPLKNLVIEAGIKGIFRSNKSDYQYYYQDNDTHTFKKDLASSNLFTNTQQVFGIYNSYNLSLRKWKIKGGLRLEETITRADFISTQTKINQHLYHLIPSLAVGYNLNNSSSFNLGFSRRIKRPGIYKLNPYVDRSNPDFESTGNPELVPTLVNNLLLGYGKSGKLTINIGLGYSFFHNMDLGVTSYDPIRKVTIATFKNVGKGNAFTADINMGYPLTKQWYAGMNTNLTYIRLKENSYTPASIHQLLYNINVSTNYKFNNGWRLIANATAISPNIVALQALSNGLFTSSFSCSKELFHGKLSLAAAVNNPFTTYRNNTVSTAGTDFFTRNTTQEYFRSFSLNANLKFGKLKEEIKKNKRGINNNDLSNSKGGF
jgi:ferric enterobactin receptor